MVINKIFSRSTVNFYLAILPALIIFVIFTAYPVLTSFYYSFTNFDGLSAQYSWKGMANYISIFTEDPYLKAALKNNLIWAFFSIVLHNIVALSIAVLLNQKIRFRNMYRSIFFLPVVMSAVSVSFIWGFMLDPNNGSLNTMLREIGLGSLALDWLGSYDLALYSIMFVESWKGIGFNILLFLAGLQVVSADVLEAAVVDGASKWRAFWHVTLPSLIPTIGLVVVLSANGAIRAFDMVFLLTEGGPGYQTQLIMYRLFKEAFVLTKFGYASAIGWVLFAILLIFAWLQLRFTRNEEQK